MTFSLRSPSQILRFFLSRGRLPFLRTGLPYRPVRNWCRRTERELFARMNGLIMRSSLSLAEVTRCIGSMKCSRTNEKRVFCCLWRHRRSCKQREVLVDKSHRNSRESIPWRSWWTVSVFLSREDEDDVRGIGKLIFVRFYLTLCHLMLTRHICEQPELAG